MRILSASFLPWSKREADSNSLSDDFKVDLIDEKFENFIKEYVDTEIAFTGRRLRSVKIEFIDAAKLARTLTFTIS